MAGSWKMEVRRTCWGWESCGSTSGCPLSWGWWHESPHSWDPGPHSPELTSLVFANLWGRMAGRWYLNKYREGSFSSELPGNRIIDSSFYGQLTVYLGIEVLLKLYLGRIHQIGAAEPNFTLFSWWLRSHPKNPVFRCGLDEIPSGSDEVGWAFHPSSKWNQNNLAFYSCAVL